MRLILTFDNFASRELLAGKMALNSQYWRQIFSLLSLSFLCILCATPTFSFHTVPIFRFLQPVYNFLSAG